MGVLSSSVSRKFAMALSGFFLIIFLTQHLIINVTSIFSENVFNFLSHFMGTNPLVQFLLQPILMLGVLFHFLMGFFLEIKNSRARVQNYTKNGSGEGSSWASRNMIISGAVILSFLCIHFYDFWLPEMDYKYWSKIPTVEDRYFEELQHKFHGNIIMVTSYCFSFLALGLHLVHGFTSSLQSIGVGSQRFKIIKKISLIYAVIVPLIFTIIAIYHYL